MTWRFPDAKFSGPLTETLLGKVRGGQRQALTDAGGENLKTFEVFDSQAGRVGDVKDFETRPAFMLFSVRSKLAENADATGINETHFLVFEYISAKTGKPEEDAALQSELAAEMRIRKRALDLILRSAKFTDLREGYAEGKVKFLGLDVSDHTEIVVAGGGGEAVADSQILMTVQMFEGV